MVSFEYSVVFQLPIQRIGISLHTCCFYIYAMYIISAYIHVHIESNRNWQISQKIIQQAFATVINPMLTEIVVIVTQQPWIYWKSSNCTFFTHTKKRELAHSRHSRFRRWGPASPARRSVLPHWGPASQNSLLVVAKWPPPSPQLPLEAGLPLFSYIQPKPHWLLLARLRSHARTGG